jgi:hypothetical protein
MSASLPQLRDAVVAALGQALPQVKVATHGGTFDEAEIKRYATQAPAVYICVVGVEGGTIFNDGRLKLPVHFAAVVVTKDAVIDNRKVERDLSGLAICSAIELTVSGNRFGLEGVFHPENLRARNEYSGSVDQMNVALWQVNWTSALLVGDPGDESFTSAVAALSQLWINGVEMGSGAEILAGLTVGTPVTPGPVESFDPDPRFTLDPPAPGVSP